MEKQSAKSEQIFLAIGAVTIWFSVITQLYLMLENRSTPLSEVLIRFLSYFTIQTNILTGICFTTLLLKPSSAWGKFFSNAQVLTAICSYISFVGLAYSILLRKLWHPTGLQQLVDELLHSVNPVIFILYWLIFVSKAELQWKNVLGWLIYPVLYLIYTLIRGALSGVYPYPFVDVNELGYTKMFLNDFGLIFAFLLLSLLFIAIGKITRR
jgi:hypothetical protein